METDDQRVRRLLEEQLKTAIQRRDAAILNFDLVTQEIPGFPHPDGTQRIVNASTEYSSAHLGLTGAIKRLSDFQNHQIIPYDLRHRGDEPERQANE